MPYEICANKMTSNLRLVSLLGAQDIYMNNNQMNIYFPCEAKFVSSLGVPLKNRKQQQRKKTENLDTKRAILNYSLRNMCSLLTKDWTA